MKLLSRSALVALLLLMVALFSASVAFAQPPAQDVVVSEETPFATNTATPTELVASPPAGDDPTAFLDPTQLSFNPTATPTELIAAPPEVTEAPVIPPADGSGGSGGGNVVPPDPVVPPEAASVLPDVDPEAAGDALLRTIYAIVGVLITSPITTQIVAYLKQIRALDRVSSQTLAFAVACVLWCILAIGDVLGIRPQLESVAVFIQTGLPNLLGMIGTLLGSSLVYKFASAYQLPGGNPRAQYTEARENVGSTVYVRHTTTDADTVRTENLAVRGAAITHTWDTSNPQWERFEALEETVHRLTTTPALDSDELARRIGAQLTPEIERIVDARIAVQFTNAVAGG